ncbi:hypothetical protein HO173_000110 [Letharia columbiana]|uniref:Uncharacterized protein n=1 Tax=Letharia columbiana TaxID=112416 RepID=A0A8H6G6G2_9LECA|nr:uncharacterized protein HO173_000110 [Letharia columbiana]KAF6241400.1 hypothetical protein HO173_000110 [Letharia columbiana]
MAHSWPAWKDDQPLKRKKEETTAAGDQARVAPHEEKEDVAPGDATDGQNKPNPSNGLDGLFDYTMSMVTTKATMAATSLIWKRTRISKFQLSDPDLLGF